MRLTRADWKAKFLGAMVGSALGDAIGELAFWNRERERLRAAVEGLKQLRYTDDTAMAIGLAESILERGQIDQQHLGDTFSRNFFREPWRGYAAGPPTIFSLVRSCGISYVEAARRLFGGTGSLGNGAAMRIVPVGLVFHRSGDLYEAAAASAEVTHAHPVGMDGAAILACAIGQAVKLSPNRGFSSSAFAARLIDISRTERNRTKMERVRILIEEEIPPPDAADQLGCSVAVDESMPFAIYSFLRHPQSFEDCLFCATLHGGDRDTLGAMAGALSGAYLGIEAVPFLWRQKLENRDLIEGLASSLHQLTLQAGGLKTALP